MFRREPQATSIAGLSREIKARRDMVHSAVERSMAEGSGAAPTESASRIYQVFAWFQGDVSAEEAYYLRG
jgi:hypothetical protein